MQDLSNVVICTSVLQKFSVLSNMRKVGKLRSLYRDQRRHVYLFDDLHCQWIAGARASDPTQLLPEVARFYWDHLDHKVPVIIVSDRLAVPAPSHPCQTLPQQLQNMHLQEEHAGAPALHQDTFLQGNQIQQGRMELEPDHPQQQQQQQQQQVLQQGVSFLSPAAFFGLFFRGGPSSGVFELFDSLLQTKCEQEQRAAAVAAGDEEAAAQAAAASQELKPYWSQLMVEEGLMQGELLQGVLHVSMRNPREAVVQVGNVSANSALGRLVRVSGRQACNRALHGDTVAGDEEGAAAVLSSTAELELLPLGEVVSLLQRSTHSVVCCLAQQEEEALLARAGGPATSRQEAVLVVPYDRRLPFVRVRTRTADRLLGQRFVVRVDGWDRTSRYPDGHMVRIIGPINDMRAESEAVLEHTGITWQPFCSGALAELPAVPGGDPQAWRVPEAERAQRRDLTGPEYFVVSIDPVGCTDVDDTMHVRALPNGGVEVGVHIADVSYFVRAGSMLDGEARDRCTIGQLDTQHSMPNNN
ncbi:hypothetical protein DUNSADRAFT_5220 [Dunaliella salina]|uniref:DIS3-like exonuclease 1 n=1 Tax=Dunaliella salina TaxID=3046 RepID=A0ABQ7GQQ7_DUNSA|nr:hypothetical protein DUNSADRAFT_5220 [Dunaliella salina]|eukprot:KAF5836943.1 hypothetical protein DUNSADRAFT_5220 [Dunaliella salina]